MRGSRMPFGRGTRCGIWYRLRSKTWKTPHLPISVGDISENFTDRIFRGASNSAKGVLLYSRGASWQLVPGCEPGRATGGHTKGTSVGVAIVVLCRPSRFSRACYGRLARRVPRARTHPRAQPCAPEAVAFSAADPRELTQRKAAAAVVYPGPPRGVSCSNASPRASGAAIGQQPRPFVRLVRGSPGFPQPARVAVVPHALLCSTLNATFLLVETIRLGNHNSRTLKSPLNPIEPSTKTLARAP